MKMKKRKKIEKAKPFVKCMECGRKTSHILKAKYNPDKLVCDMCYWIQPGMERENIFLSGK